MVVIMIRIETRRRNMYKEIISGTFQDFLRKKKTENLNKTNFK